MHKYAQTSLDGELEGQFPCHVKMTSFAIRSMVNETQLSFLVRQSCVLSVVGHLELYIFFISSIRHDGGYLRNQAALHRPEYCRKKA